MRFDPHAHGPGTLRTVDRSHWLASIACPSSTLCLVADDAGRVLVGDPHQNAWTTETVAEAAPLAGDRLHVGTLCVAVDAAGQAFLGRRS